MHYVGHVDWSFTDQPCPASPTSIGPQPPPDRRSGPGRRAHRGRGRRARRRRLARPAHPFVRGGPVRPGRRADDRPRRARPSPRCRATTPTWRSGPGTRSPTPRRSRSAGSRSTRRMRLDPAARAPRHVLRMARSTSPPWRHGPPGRRSAIPTLRSVGHYDGTPPQAEALRVNDPARGRAPAGMDMAILAYSGISVKMLVDRTFGRRPADDVHRRLRAERRRPGPRPPVRGGVLLPRRRDRGRPRRRAATRSARAMSRSPASARPTASSTPAAAACAGSRPRRRSRRRGTPIAGSMPGSGSRSTEMTSDGCILVVGGTAGIGKELARHYAGTGRETILTGRDRARRPKPSPPRSAARRAGSASTSPDPKTIRDALASVGPGALPRDRRHPARRQHDPRLRHRPGDGAGDAQARRLRRGRPRPPRPAPARQLDRPVRRPGQGPAVSGLDDGVDRQRRDRRAGPHASPGSWRRSGSTSSTRGSPATARTGTASRRRSSRATCRRPSPRSSRRWTTSSTGRGSCSRTRRSTGSTSWSTTEG